MRSNFHREMGPLKTVICPCLPPMMYINKFNWFLLEFIIFFSVLSVIGGDWHSSSLKALLEETGGSGFFNISCTVPVDTGLGFLLGSTGVVNGLGLIFTLAKEVILTADLCPANKDWLGFISTKSWFSLAWKSWNDVKLERDGTLHRLRN